MTAVINRLRQVRESKRITQSELARRVGVVRQSVSAYESSIQLPSLEVALKLACQLKVPLEHLFDLDLKGATPVSKRSYDPISRSCGIGSRSAVSVDKVMEVRIDYPELVYMFEGSITCKGNTFGAAIGRIPTKKVMKDAEKEVKDLMKLLYPRVKMQIICDTAVNSPSDLNENHLYISIIGPASELREIFLSDPPVAVGDWTFPEVL